MTTGSSKRSSVVYCQTAKELLDKFAQTVAALVELHQGQFDAIVSGDADASRFDDLIHMANERKNDAKYSYLAHVEAHGCSTDKHGPDPKGTGENYR